MSWQIETTRKFDKEFKMFLKWRGFELDHSSFELRFNEPQNFTKYRETELDGTRIGTFTQLEAFPYLSNLLFMQRFLGLSEEEMQENTELWLEENEEDVPPKKGGRILFTTILCSGVALSSSFLSCSSFMATYCGSK